MSVNKSYYYNSYLFYSKSWNILFKIDIFRRGFDRNCDVNLMLYFTLHLCMFYVYIPALINAKNLSAGYFYMPVLFIEAAPAVIWNIDSYISDMQNSLQFWLKLFVNQLSTILFVSFLSCLDTHKMFKSSKDKKVGSLLL